MKILRIAKTGRRFTITSFVEKWAGPIGAALDSELVSADFLYGGRNSQVFLLTMGNAQKFVFKLYFRSLDDSRDRQGTEWLASEFMWKKYLRVIPKPIATNPLAGWSVFEYINGEKLHRNNIGLDDLAQFIHFLAELKKIFSEADRIHVLPLASEACFSCPELFNNIEGRLAKLSNMDSDMACKLDVIGFLNTQLIPSYKGFKEALLEQNWGGAIPNGEMTLSPSDFGLHNAIRKMSGEIIFLDFEYFGRDDIAKTVSDFLLHPGMALTQSHKTYFLDRILDQFDVSEIFKDRLKAYYPLFAIKWCCIMLNEFLPEHFSRRRFANHDHDLNIEQLQTQLDKAKTLLSEIKKDSFPYELN